MNRRIVFVKLATTLAAVSIVATACGSSGSEERPPPEHQAKVEKPDAATATEKPKEAQVQADPVVQPDDQYRTAGAPSQPITAASPILGVDTSTQATNLRREGQETFRGQSDSNGKDIGLTAQRNAAFLTRPALLSSLREVISPDDSRVEQQFVKLLSANSNAAILNDSSGIVGELYNEPEISNVKMAELQLGVQRMNDKGLYNADARTRVAFLQGMINERLNYDHNVDKLHSAFVVGLPILALGAMSAYGLPQKAYAKVEEDGFLGATKLGFLAKKVKDGASVGGKRLSGLASFAGMRSGPRLTSVEIAKRSLLDGCKLDEAKIESLGLEAVGREKLPRSSLWTYTKTPTLKYDIVDEIEGKELGPDTRVLIFSVRQGYVYPRSLIRTREMTTNEAYAFRDEITQNASEAAGEANLAAKDAETGVIYPTDIPAQAIPEIQPFAVTPTAEEAANRDLMVDHESDFHPAHRAFAEARAEGLTAWNATRDGFNHAAQSTRLGLTRSASYVANGAKQARATVAKTKAVVIDPMINNFDKTAFAVTTIGAGVAASAIFVPAYAMGYEHGEDRQSVFLESLVPSDTLYKLTNVEKLSKR